ncbi:tetratricopeptide repeat protein [Roseibium sp. FZY0029]|uniref:tetratricopeptide repeat protein n=1 Tax=Roseibium sp. FZY0029 TaxID=3116647 RepID=UPI002E9E4A13|nr:tetratricopeptide repeat protein [Roseibium sp. FZY0029]
MTRLFSQVFRHSAGLLLLAAALCLTVHVPPAGATPEQDALFNALKNAPTEEDASRIEDDIWNSWLDAAPSPDIRQKVDEAMRRRDGYDFQGAKELLDQVVEEAADYSEGWNQRAFILFLQGNYEASLEDIERALALEPRHFGALSGKAIILMTLGRVEAGQEVLREAVGIHPFLKERDMLIKPQGVDL